MAFCAKCGNAVSDGVSFCPSCGAAVGAAGGPAAAPPYTPYAAPPSAPPYGAPQTPPYGAPQAPPYGAPPNQIYAPATSGMQENVAGMLCYILGWLTGIIFLLVDKRPFVRFHAAQSIVVFGTLFLLRIILSYMWVSSLYYGAGFGFHFMLSGLLSLVTLGAWVVLMVMAYQGKNFEVPVAAGLARSIAGKVQ